MRESYFEYCAKIDGREMWIEVSELAICHWYDRSGALEAISDLLALDKRVFLDFVFGAVDSRSARRIARDRENFTISVGLPPALFSYIRRLAKLSAKTGMTADEEGELNALLEPVFREELQGGPPILDHCREAQSRPEKLMCGQVVFDLVFATSTAMVTWDGRDRVLTPSTKYSSDPLG